MPSSGKLVDWCLECEDIADADCYWLTRSHETVDIDPDTGEVATEAYDHPGVDWLGPVP
jgi:hypothetical protein